MANLEQRRGGEARAAAERMFAGDFSAPAMNDFLRLVFPAYVANPASGWALRLQWRGGGPLLRAAGASL